MKINLTLGQKGLLLVAIPLAFELACVGVLFAVWQESRNQTERELHDKDIVSEVNNLMQLTMTTANSGLVDIVSQSDILNSKRLRSRQEIYSSLRILHDLVRDDPVQKSFVNNGSAHLQNVIKACTGFSYIGPGEQQERLKRLIAVDKEITDFGTDMTKLLEAQALHAKAFHQAGATSQNKINAILLTLIFSSISLAVGLAVYFNKQAAERLSFVMDSITHLSAGNYGSLPLGGEDEFAVLDQDIHGMAAQILEATRKERAVIENALDVIFSINKKGQFTAVNPAATKSWGYSQDDLLKMTISDVLLEDNRAEVIKQLREAAINQKPCSLEAQTIAADSSRIEQLWSVSWSEPEQTLFCLAHDITERKRVERLKQEFVAMITHDLRTPLTSINIMLAILAAPSSDLTPEWRLKVKKSEESSTRLITLINDLLDLEKMQVGKLAIKPDICLIDDLIESSIASVQGFADSKSIKLLQQKKEALTVLADERRLIQVIVNLLSNAIKFSPPSSTIQLSTMAAGKLVELAIADKGRGIPADKLQGIFNRFEQVHNSDNGAMGGTGLGLAICKEIIRAHGGQIGVESQEGAGSTFWFRLPSAEQ